MDKSTKIKKLKKKLKKAKKDNHLMLEKHVDVVFHCMKTIAEYQTKKRNLEDTPELFGAYSNAMAILAALHISAELTANLDE